MSAPEQSVNRRIFDETYRPAQLELKQPTPYDRRMVKLRQDLIARHGRGRDVLDLCCGIGSYLVPNLSLFSTATGVDFSGQLLDELSERLPEPRPTNLRLIEADARDLPLEDDSFDFVWSYGSLYYVPDVQLAVAEVSRVLRPNGFAALELGNHWSLNTFVAEIQHRRVGSAKPYHVSYRAMRNAFESSSLAIRSWRSFQILPMYGAPYGYRALEPVFSPRWKTPMARDVRGRMLDELVSGALRPLAFRHLVVAQRV
jgi:ubiquinone/menaquinone biosynthesis C-methylase UbiE